MIHVNAAYSGRIAVAYQRSPEDPCVSVSSSGTLVFSCMVSIYECESTGGSEWVLSDTIELKDVVVNQSGLSHQNIDLSYLNRLVQNRSKLTSAFSSDETHSNADHHPSSEALQHVSSKFHVKFLMFFY